MKSPIRLENLDAIEENIRYRIKQLDEEYARAKSTLERELANFLTNKQSIIEAAEKYGGERIVEDSAQPGAPRRSPYDGTSADLPWGRYASGVDHVLYVLRAAGSRGLGRLEVVDRIGEISGDKPPINSVTTWLYRARMRGEVKNRKRKWYAVQQSGKLFR
jgi:hypothetical protein